MRTVTPVTSTRGGARRLAALLAALVAASFLVVSTPTRAAAATCSSTTVNVVAHTDDDLLFTSPDIMRDAGVGACLLTVYLTAGDAGGGSGYWAPRETGVEAAYARFFGVSNSWSTSTVNYNGASIRKRTLNARPNVSMLFLRLPDGFPLGTGSPAYAYQSLQRLMNGTIGSMRAVDGSATYSYSSLRATLLSILNAASPSTIRTLDYVSAYGSGDHSDHYSAARLLKEAEASYSRPRSLLSYQGYGTEDRPQNVFGTDYTRKLDAFEYYADYDEDVCFGGCPGSQEDGWARRQYVVTATNGGTLPSQSGGTYTASSAASDQGAAKAFDGVVDGWPGDSAREWATNGGGAGSWVQVSFSSAKSVSSVVLYDRPNSDDRVMGGRLEFSDGSTVTVPALDNNGAQALITFPPRTTTRVRFVVTSVSSSTYSVGLAEMDVRSSAGSAPVANAGRDAVVGVGQRVTLDGSASADPDGTPLTYAWTQVSGPAVTLTGPTTAKPTVTLTTAGAYTFRLTVSDGALTASDDVVVTVDGTTGPNVAPSATATASSQVTGGEAAKAIDGVVDGYPNDPTKEWETNVGKAGSWLRLAWTSPVTVNRVVLHDRPNLDDQVTSGQLEFSDGSVVPVPALTNNGSATTVTFPAKTTSFMRFVVNSVSASTYAIGLAEIQAWSPLNPPSTTTTTTTTTTPPTTTTTSPPVTTTTPPVTTTTPPVTTTTPPVTTTTPPVTTTTPPVTTTTPPVTTTTPPVTTTTPPVTTTTPPVTTTTPPVTTTAPPVTTTAPPVTTTTPPVTTTAPPVTTTTPPVTTTTTPPVTASLSRVWGQTLFDTAAAISQDAFPAGASTVYVATGATFPDALAAAPSAALLGAPILLVNPDSIPAATAQELERLAPDHIILLGGPLAVSAAVEQTLDGYAGAGTVTRLSGETLYHTAAAISAATFGPGVDTVYVATGEDFPDALAGGAVAARDGAPVILVAQDSIPDASAAELDRLNPTSIVVLGGPLAVADSVLTGLAQFTTAQTPASVTRIAGQSAYETAVAVSTSAYPTGADVVYLATGGGFPDALAASPVAGTRNAPVLLLPPDGTVPAVVAAEIQRLGPQSVIALGGELAITAGQYDTIAVLLTAGTTP